MSADSCERPPRHTVLHHPYFHNKRPPLHQNRSLSQKSDDSYNYQNHPNYVNEDEDDGTRKSQSAFDLRTYLAKSSIEGSVGSDNNEVIRQPKCIITPCSISSKSESPEEEEEKEREQIVIDLDEEDLQSGEEEGEKSILLIPKGNKKATQV